MENKQTATVVVDSRSQVMTVTGKHGRAVYNPKTRELDFIIDTPEGAMRGILKLPDKTKTPARTSRRFQGKYIQLA